MKLKLLTAMVAALLLAGCSTPKPISVSEAYYIDYNNVYKKTGVRITEAWPNFDYEPLGSLQIVDYGGYVESRLVADPYGPDLYGITHMVVDAGGKYYNPTSETAALKAAEKAKEKGANYIVNLRISSGYTTSPNAETKVKYVMVTGMVVKRK